MFRSSVGTLVLYPPPISLHKYTVGHFTSYLLHRMTVEGQSPICC